MRKSESRMQPVVAAFKDQVLYLTHHLNAQAISSLKTTAAAIETEVAALIERAGDGGREIPILYGGSVTTAPASALLAADEVGGLLVGGASLDPASWAAICSA